MKEKAIDRILKKIPDEKRRFTRISMYIVEQISIYLKDKNIHKSALAKYLNITNDEIDNILDGTYNFDIETVARIESFLKLDIITTPNQSNLNTGIEIKNLIVTNIRSTPVTSSYYYTEQMNRMVYRKTRRERIFSRNLEKNS
ncbi:MAG: hypothetical protein K1X86_02485 [Ignavibacteria bacterium]|nr:hypothetical protein [Ignavibacteria bacterium]